MSDQQKQDSNLQPPYYFEEDTISLMDIMLTLVRQLKIILIPPIIFCILAIINVQFIAKSVYTSTAKIMPSSGGGGISQAAGLAFSNTATAAAHSMSYPLTIHYGIPHGIASSISLIPLLEKNAEFIKEPLDRICENNELTYDELKQAIKAIPNGVIPYKLKEWSIPEDQLIKLAAESFTKGRMENNIVDLTRDDVLMILKEIY